MYNAVAFSIFTILYNHLVTNIFTIPKGKSVSIMQSPTLPTLSISGNYKFHYVSMDLPTSDISYGLLCLVSFI